MGASETERHYVLGTAGHIDHGKSALVKALTGIDPDRLKEEKKRGITIELGFAHLAYDDGTLLGIVDVPGHERFVRHMVAGATGIDLVALVVAADEGVMPQTREHLDICSLLGVRSGLVVLTKIDLVDDREWLDLVEEDIRDFLAGTFLEGCPIIRTSAMTGEGLGGLRELLRDAAAGSAPRSRAGLFRLPVDRVFTMRGFGTVITGTLVSGSLKTGDRVLVYPPRFEAKVRGIQVHSREVEEAVAGQRTAVNLQGVEKAAIKRGFLLAGEDNLPVSSRVDVELNYLKSASRPLKNRAKVRFHTFTSEVMARVALLDKERLAPGETGFAQVITEEPVSVLREDRFVIRSYSPVFTIGGGRVLHPEPPRHRKKHHWVIGHLEGLATGDGLRVVRVHLKEAGPGGVTKDGLAVSANISGRELEDILARGVKEGWAVPVPQDPGRYLSLEVLSGLKSEVEEVLGRYHGANPLKRGMSKEEIGPRLSVSPGPKVMAAVLGSLEEEGRVFIEGADVRLKGHRVDLTDDETKLRRRMGSIYRDAGLSPPFFRDVVKELPQGGKNARGILDIMLKDGELVKVKEDMFFHREALDELREKVVDFLKEHGEMDTSQFKSLTGTSRKYTIPLAEYFDKARVTIRVGEKRRLREAGAGARKEP